MAVCVLALGPAFAPDTAHAIGNCYFKRTPPVTLKSMGPCEFDPVTLSFKGSPAEQAKCLLNPVERVGRLGRPLGGLPNELATRIGTQLDLPAREKFGKWLEVRGLGDTLATSVERTVSHARDNDRTSRRASYFVMHDTSTPNYGALPWPRNIDEDPKVNNLDRYRCANDIERAHVFINRGGAVMLAHDFETPWRATKFEMATNFGTDLKGLFLHVELIQPRRRDPKFGRGNDFLAPMPGFTSPQYDALGVVYALASVRAGSWLIPAFHAVLDEGIRDKHDDPQNFELPLFAASLERLLHSLKQPISRETAN
jgi:hypothetical protein